MSIAILQSDCKRAVHQLGPLSNEELDEIINNDEKIEEILHNLDQSYLKEIGDEKENVLAANNSLAELNLSREPELVEGREKLQELTEEGERLSKLVDEKTRELRGKTGDMSLETALALLQTAASEIEEESDNIAKKFLEGGAMELDEFLDQFLTRRELMHKRLVKAEKLTKIISRDPSLNGPNYANTPPMHVNPGYFPSPVTYPSRTVPYPTGPLNMPMPPGMNYFQNHF